MFLPLISGALPCTGSKTAQSSPMFAPCATPKPPIKPAQRSETMSPYKLGKTKTSNCEGFCTSCIQRLSTRISLGVISGYSFATSLKHSKNNPSESLQILALVTAQTSLLLFLTA